MKRAILVTSAILATAGLWGDRNPAIGADAPAGAEVGSPAFGFELPDVYGKVFKLAEFKGRIVVLEWINQACPVSRGKHDDGVMQKTYKKYAKDGVIWLAIDSTHGRKPEQNRVYAAEQQLAYPILQDADGKVGRAYGARTTPHMFVIDKKGVLAYDGAIDDKADKNYVVAALDALLADKPVTTAKTAPYGCSVKYR